MAAYFKTGNGPSCFHKMWEIWLALFILTDVLHSAHHACIQNALTLNKITEHEVTQYVTIRVQMSYRRTPIYLTMNKVSHDNQIIISTAIGISNLATLHMYTYRDSQICRISLTFSRSGNRKYTQFSFSIVLQNVKWKSLQRYVPEAGTKCGLGSIQLYLHTAPSRHVDE